MKYRTLKKRTKRNIKRYEKHRVHAERELNLIIKEFEILNQGKSQKQILESAKQHVLAHEKLTNYVGARTVPMTFGTAIIVYYLTSTLLDMKNPQSYMFTVLENIKDQILIVQVVWIFLAIIVALPIIFIVILALYIILLDDKKHRYEIYKHQIMVNMIEKRLKDL